MVSQQRINMQQRASNFSVSPKVISKREAIDKKRAHPESFSMRKIGLVEVGVAVTPPDSPSSELCLTPKNSNTNSTVDFMAGNFAWFQFFFCRVGVSPLVCIVDVLKGGLFQLDFYIQHSLEGFLSAFPHMQSIFFGPFGVFSDDNAGSIRYLQILQFITNPTSVVPPEVSLVVDHAEVGFLTDSGLIASNPGLSLDLLVFWLREEARSFVIGAELEDRNISAHFFMDLFRKQFHTRIGSFRRSLTPNPALARRGNLGYDLGLRYFTLMVLEGMIASGVSDCQYPLLFDCASGLMKRCIQDWIPTPYMLHALGFPPLPLPSNNGGQLMHLHLLPQPAPPVVPNGSPHYFLPMQGLPWERE